MKTGEKLLLVALGGAVGYVAAKYGKQIVATVKENADKEHLESIANDIKEHGKKVADSVKKSADSVKKSVADLRYEMEKGMFADLGDFDDIEDYFMCKNEEDVAPKKNGYVTVPVTDADVEKKEDLPPVDVKVSENPEEVRKVVEETLAEAEELIKEETKTTEVKSAAEVLKKRRAQNVNKTRAKKTVKVEDAEPVKEEVKTETVENKAE